MRRLCALFASGLTAVVLVACGSGAQPVTNAATHSVGKTGATTGTTGPVTPKTSGRLRGDEDDDDTESNPYGENKDDNDADFDNDSPAKQSKTFYDSDDGPILHFGHAASDADKRQITTLVESYYAAAASSDGVTACALMFSLYAETIPEDFGRGAGPAYSRGNTCPVVMKKLFEHSHAELAAPVKVMLVRVEGKQAHVAVGSTTAPARVIALKREGRTWRVTSLFGVPLI